MKRTLLLIAVSTFGLSTLNSCDTYHSLTNASSVAQLAGNPFMQNVARSLLKNMTGMLMQNGIQNIGKLGLNTNLSSLLSSATAISGFKNMLGSTYGLSNNIIDKNFSKLGSIKDVVGLVASSGTKGLSFY
jgi:hypothetical protein